jgi:hypothetical protein
MLRRTAVLGVLVLALAAACGPREANPEDMRETATSCGIRSFEVAATRVASQSPFALHYVADGDDRAKLDCYRARLESRGFRSTLVLGTTRDLSTDDGLLFARVSETCELPASAIITQREGQIRNFIIVYGASGISEPIQQCVSRQLRASGRFDDIQFTDSEVPPMPTIRF